jgi:hypothetical protein
MVGHTPIIMHCRYGSVDVLPCETPSHHFRQPQTEFVPHPLERIVVPNIGQNQEKLQASICLPTRNPSKSFSTAATARSREASGTPVNATFCPSILHKIQHARKTFKYHFPYESIAYQTQVSMAPVPLTRDGQ